MSPVTHFLTGWFFASCATLNRKDRALYSLCQQPYPSTLRNFPG
jgi:hypothetical protein